MLGSLRVRLPLVFLAGIVLAGVITTAISIRLFQQFTENQTLSKLNREAHGIAELYSKAVNAGYGNKNKDQKAPTFAGKTLEKATGDRIYLLGPRLGLFPGQITGLRPLPQEPIDWHIGKSVTFEFTPPGQHRRYLAVANPIASSGTTIGAIVVATPKTDIRQQVFSLIGRLAIAGALGLLVAALLAWYLSRRIVRPILQLSDAVDEVANGNYDVKVPQNAPGELGHLSARVGEMADRLGVVEQMERNFLMSVSHELRTPLTAIRGHVAALLEGVIAEPELRRNSLETVEAETQRLERLVGDILDLAKLDTNRFTVTTRGGRHGRAHRAGVRPLPRRSAAAVDRLSPAARRATGDHLGRRPCPAGRRQPALECVPRDTRRRAHHARTGAAERHRARRGRGHGAGHPGGGT